MQQLTLEDGRVVHFTPASSTEADEIIALYHRVYKGHYTLQEVTQADILRKKVEDPNYFWTLAKIGDDIVGSVIFAIDPVNKIGKCYAAAVMSEFRGQDVMRTMVLHGLDRLTKRTRSCDVIFATTRTVSFAPQVVLEHLGFYPMGIFPNVRKVESFETHGLEVYFRPESLPLRRKRPQLVPEVGSFFQIVRKLLDLEDYDTIDLEQADLRRMGDPIRFGVERDSDDIRVKCEYYQDKDLMDRVFFPFTEPNLLFHSEDGKAEIFVNFNELDGNGVIVAYRIDHPDLRRVLMWFCEAASMVGMRYIEMLVSAFRPEIQRVALDARFLPCAYFPGMRMAPDGQREDYLVFSRSFESLDFMDMHLVATNRKFLDAFMKCWYEMLVRSQPDFDEEWRIG